MVRALPSLRATTVHASPCLRSCFSPLFVPKSQDETNPLQPTDSHTEAPLRTQAFPHAPTAQDGMAPARPRCSGGERRRLRLPVGDRSRWRRLRRPMFARVCMTQRTPLHSCTKRVNARRKSMHEESQCTNASLRRHTQPLIGRSTGSRWTRCRCVVRGLC